MNTEKLTKLENHFKFGENWYEYIGLLSKEHEEKAVESLENLISRNDIEGKSFLDIGCGSGLSMLAALKLGSKCVVGIDIDPSSVKAAKKVLQKRSLSDNWKVLEQSVFDLPIKNQRKYDIVHSWGVLHHTGQMWKAVDVAQSLVGPAGTLCVAMYRKSAFCAFWRFEKLIYTKAPSFFQYLLRILFKTLILLGIVLSFRNPIKYIKAYKNARGMDWHHDVHDWLGGYPYESVFPEEVVKFLTSKGFAIIKINEKKPLCGGLFGTHCDEFVAKRIS